MPPATETVSETWFAGVARLVLSVADVTPLRATPVDGDKVPRLLVIDSAVSVVKAAGAPLAS